MADLRAPDPTLDALGPVYVMLMPAAEDHRHPLEVAHYCPDQETDGPAKCGFTFPGLPTWLPAQSAAYFAVPCRDCFPDAPPPGWDVDRPGGLRRSGVPVGTPYLRDDGGLAWQVPDREAVR